MSNYEQAVFISYAWGGEREDIVNQIDKTLQKRGIQIVRDKRALGYRGSIKEFMERIGQGNCVILVISDKYLRSPNCMFELVEVAENKRFHDRIFPIVLSDARIYDPVTRIEYVKHWEAKRAELAEAMKELDPANLQGIRDDMDLYDRIRVRISGITSILKDMNTLTPDMHRDSDFGDLYDAIVKRMEESPVVSAANADDVPKKVQGKTDRKDGEQAARLAAQNARDDFKAKSDQFESERATVIRASALLAQGKQLSQNKDWTGAARTFRQVLELIPNHPETLRLLSNAQAQLRPGHESVEHKMEVQDGNQGSAQTGNRSAGEMVGRSQIGLSRKTIIFGAVGSLTVLAGLIGAFVLLGDNKPASITSVGMVEIPSGSYLIGMDTTVNLADYWIDRYEVTNSDYARFIDGTKSDPPTYWVGGEIPAGRRNHPVAQITWDQATDYCRWAGKRLPTETEWEVAARGPFGWKYPWGNEPGDVQQEAKGTRPVDGNPANISFFGAYYMSGNVWEWVRDPFTSTANGEHVIRGGAYGPLDVLTTAISVPDDGPVNEKMGFRCAASGENVTRVYDETLALDDDFESTNTNWPGIQEDNFLFDYHELGFYHVEARAADKFIPAFYDHDMYSNFVMETGVFVDAANTDNKQGSFLYGLGVQTTEEQFYAFLISADDQNWQISKGSLNPGAVLGDISDLTIVKTGVEHSIRGASEEEEDRLTLIANGTEFSYYVNGNLVYKVTVEEHRKVKVGFVVETLKDVSRVHIHFNWVKLQNIEQFDG